MIALTHLTGRQVWVNPDLLQSMEATPDTLLVLVNGSHMIVREAPTEVAARIVEFRARVMATASRLDPELLLPAEHGGDLEGEEGQ